jgi:hypothetical protein
VGRSEASATPTASPTGTATSATGVAAPAIAAAAVSASVIDPNAARRDARHILAGRRYRGAPVPRPLHGVLRWIGDRLAPIARWIGDRFSWLPDPAVPWIQGVALVAVAFVIAVFVTSMVKAHANARAARLGTGADGRHASARGDDPAALEAAAVKAEARGDFALAVRLRFRAGLLRLDRDAHAITYRPSIPTVEVRAELASPTFDGLADTFEGITYGGNDAEPIDPADARREWPRVLDAARHR